MEEMILTGYCRCLDQSRMVTVEWEQSEPEADCSFAACPHLRRLRNRPGH